MHAEYGDPAREARAAGAGLMLTPELALCGYPPEDLLLRPDFYRACTRELASLAREIRGIEVVVGHPQLDGDKHFNAASLLRDGAVVAATYRKHRLPNYEVFDEERYFDAGSEPCVVEVQGVRIGLNICADVGGGGRCRRGAAPRRRIAGRPQCFALPHRQAGTALRGVARSHRGYRHTRDLHQYGGRAGRTGVRRRLVCAESCGRSGVSGALVRREHRLSELCRRRFVRGIGGIARFAGSGGLRRVVARRTRLSGKNRFPGAIVGLSGGIDSALPCALPSMPWARTRCGRS